MTMAYPATVYLGIGSNVDAVENLRLGLRELKKRYGELQLSAVYQNAAVGFEGDDFLNLVARFQSEQIPQLICEQIELIHNLAGRTRSGNKWEARPLDIDLLLYNAEVIDAPPVRVPRSDILEYSFVLRPLAELAPQLVHPVTGRTMRQHWQEFDDTCHPLERVDVSL